MESARRWEALLAEFEAELYSPEEFSATWSAPTDLGPIPAELVARARGIHAAQRARISVLELEKSSTARHLAALDAVAARPDSDQPLYLDTAG